MHANGGKPLEVGVPVLLWPPLQDEILEEPIAMLFVKRLNSLPVVFLHLSPRQVVEPEVVGNFRVCAEQIREATHGLKAFRATMDVFSQLILVKG